MGLLARSRLVRNLTVALGITLGLAACEVDFKVPENSAITCETDAQCPPAYECRAARCFKRKAEETPPEVVPTSISIAPNPTNGATPVIVSFEVTEPLAAAPVVELAATPPLTFDLVSTTDTQYAY